jgi:formylglycine-generating enzyme required for sulfatase activity
VDVISDDGADLAHVDPTDKNVQNKYFAGFARGTQVRDEPAPAGQSFKDRPDCPGMVVVPPGSFTMDTPPDEEFATEREDQVRVSIARPFAVGRFAATRASFGVSER